MLKQEADDVIERIRDDLKRHGNQSLEGSRIRVQPAFMD